MSFNSIDYLLFFPIVVIAYYIIPKRLKVFWLLISSYYFYMSWNIKYGILILFSTLVAYICGLCLDKIDSSGIEINRKVKKVAIFVGVTINLGLLLYFKYTNFVFDNLYSIANRFGVGFQHPNFDIVLPVGISFFIFQSIGYTIDVYRNDIKAERNFFKFALFVSFFPQLVAGPIERSNNLLPQIQEDRYFDVDNVKNGLLTMAYGLFMKIVVADNIATIIDPVFDTPDSYSGMAIVFSAMLFAFQIYCDFNGYTKMAIGSARVMGFQLNRNFDSPYMAISIKDFWRRWHISLTSWFRDYLYIPLGGNRKGKIRKYINTLIVFLFSGLWHGAAWHYVIWGGINGIFIVLEDCLTTLYKKVCTILMINRDLLMYKIFGRIITFVIVSFSWLFFRVSSLKTAIHMLEIVVRDFRPAWFWGFNFVDLFSDSVILMTVFASLLIVILIDILCYYGND